MGKISLDFISRCFYIVYYIKFALAFFYPDIAQQYTDFCSSCNLSSDSGKVTAARECWGFFFVALMWTAVAQMDKDKCQRKVMQYAIMLPFAKLIVLVQFGMSALGTESYQFISGVTENLLLFLGSVLTCYVWFPVGKPKKNATSFFDYTEYTNAVRIQYIEQFILFIFSFYYIANGQTDQLTPNDGGLFGAAMAAATQLGLGTLLAGVSQCDNADQDKVVKYYMVKKCIELYYLSALLIPFAIAAGGDAGLTGVYCTTAWYICTLIQMMMCCYHSTPNRASFWVSSLVFGFLGGLGMFFPSSTAATFYRVPELVGANDVVFKIIGLFCVLMAAAFMAFANEFNMDQFEKMFIYSYGGLCLYCFYNDLYFGLFSDILNVFLIWCIWMTWGEVGPSINVSKFVPKILSKTAKKALSPMTSPKMASMKSRGRSKTPGRKSQ